MTHRSGKFVWYELSTSDSKAAETFYRSVIGWDAKDSGMPDGAYTILFAGPDMVGGIMTIPENACAAQAKPGWVGYIGVDDVDAHAAWVMEAGGSLHRAPQDIPGIGRFAVVADPHGAVFILFKGSSDQEPRTVPPGTLGSIGWHELHAGDGKAAFEFYAGLFGWTKADAIDMGPMGVYQTFTTGGAPVGGMMTKMPQTPAPFWIYYFNVESIEAALGRAVAGGGKVILPPHQAPNGSWFVQCTDPQGAVFAMVATMR